MARRKSNESNNEDFPIKYLLVEFDGTLVDSIPTLQIAYREFLEKLGHQGTSQEFQSLLGMSVKDSISLLRAKYHLRDDLSQLIASYQESLRTHYLEQVSLYPEARQALQYIKDQGVKLVLVAASVSLNLVKETLTANEFSKVFDKVIAEEEGTLEKAVKLLKIEPMQAVAVVGTLKGMKEALSVDLITLFLEFEGVEGVESVEGVEGFERKEKTIVDSMRGDDLEVLKGWGEVMVMFQELVEMKDYDFSD